MAAVTTVYSDTYTGNLCYGPNDADSTGYGCYQITHSRGECTITYSVPAPTTSKDSDKAEFEKPIRHWSAPTECLLPHLSVVPRPVIKSVAKAKNRENLGCKNFQRR